MPITRSPITVGIVLIGVGGLSLTGGRTIPIMVMRSICALGIAIAFGVGMAMAISAA